MKQEWQMPAQSIRSAVDAEATSSAASDVPLPATETTDAGSDWRSQWYPVAFVEDLPDDRPYAFTLFDQPLVLFRGARSQWFCGEDRCPHRAARLSEGRLQDGRLECLYHGWQFAADGTCEHIPQWPQNRPRPEAACLKRYPIELRQGILWVWPGSSRSADPSGIALVAALDEPDVVVVDYATDLPYGQSFLIENVLDVAHIHIAHDGMRGGGRRELALPLEFEILEEGSAGIRASYRSIGLPDHLTGASHARAVLEFRAPNLVHYITEYRDSSLIAGLALYSLPLGVDRCRLLYRKYSNFYSRRERHKPRWLEHWTQNEILRQDMSLIIGQNQAIRGSDRALRELWLPLKTSDTLVLRYRKWLDAHAADRPDHLGWTFRRERPGLSGASADVANANTTFRLHTQHCSSCLRAHRRLGQTQVSVRACMLLAVPVMAITTGAAQWLTAAGYGLAVAALWILDRSRRRFE
jgi:phenylpropionate dioxygenase-like ring-hydroxylating dioxygenase large terminal subunit